MIKYPRTLHLQGSCKQSGDDDLDSVPFSEIKGKFLVIEEKVDGANCGISFESDKMMLQSRGHYLSGNDHPQFNFFKAWASVKQNKLFEILGNRYIMYGEWLYAKHTIFYNALPHYFLEFDIYDRESDVFLGTKTRHKMLKCSGIVSVPVILSYVVEHIEEIIGLVGPSEFRGNDYIEHIIHAAKVAGVKLDDVVQQTDQTMWSEGVYIKDETSGNVDNRFKWVRSSFLQTILASGSHWQNRPIVVNRLAEGVDIYL